MLSLIGAITGIIGAATGILSLFISLRSLTQTDQLKSQELRMERSRLINKTEVALIKAKKLSQVAAQSKIYRLARQGISQSSTADTWKMMLEQNNNIIAAIQRDQFEILASAALDKSSLELQIQQLHLIEEKLSFIIEDLNNSLEDDDAAKKAA